MVKYFCCYGSVRYFPPFSGIYVVVIGKKGGKLRRQILQPSQAIDFQSILIYGTNKQTGRHPIVSK